MKRHYDRSAVPRRFKVGDKVLALLPIPGSALSAKFSGPYDICDCLSDTDYVIGTPERRRKTRVCHVNMLKLYHCREETDRSPVDLKSSQPAANPGISALIVTDHPNRSETDDLEMRNSTHQGARLPNYEMLKTLPSQLCHLTAEQQQDVVDLVYRFACLFNDVPTQTTVLSASY